MKDPKEPKMPIGRKDTDDKTPSAARSAGRGEGDDPNRPKHPHEIEPAKPDEATPEKQTEFEPPKRDTITTDVPTEAPLEKPAEIPVENPEDDPFR